MHVVKEAEDDVMRQPRETRDVTVARQLQQTQQLQDGDRVTASGA